MTEAAKPTPYSAAARRASPGLMRSIKSGAMPTSGRPASLDAGDENILSTTMPLVSGEIDVFKDLPDLGGMPAPTDFDGLNGEPVQAVDSTNARPAPQEAPQASPPQEGHSVQRKASPFSKFVQAASQNTSSVQKKVDSDDHHHLADIGLPTGLVSEQESTSSARVETEDAADDGGQSSPDSEVDGYANLNAILEVKTSSYTRFSPDAKKVANHQPKDYAKERPGSAYSKFAESSLATAQGRSVAIDIAAAKVLTPLVSAVSLQHGMPGNSKDKAEALKSMIIEVKKITSELILPISPYAAASPALRSQLMQVVAGVVSRRWIETGAADLDLFADTFRDLVNSSDDYFAAVINEIAADRYQPVDSEDTARARIFVTVSECAWKMLDFVQHERLRLQVADPVQKCYFTYDHYAADLAGKMVEMALSEVRGLMPNITNEDMRIAHLQNSLRRFVELAGAEYVLTTRKLMNWISEDGVDKNTFVARKQGINGRLMSEILPRIMDVAKKSFIAIDQSARRMLDEQPLNPPSNTSAEMEISK